MAKSKKVKSVKETEIVVVLDRSGSMGSIAPATVQGFNEFLNEQQNAEGEAFITLVQFDDSYEMNYQGVPVKNVSPLILGESFVPRGSTALLDSIGKTIENLKTDRDVVFVIITDGEENASTTYKREAINKMIATCEKEEGWKFLFLAANQDAIRAGNSIGIRSANSMTYSATTKGASKAFQTISSNMSSYRSSKLVNTDSLATASLFFTDEQRDEAVESK